MIKVPNMDKLACVPLHLPQWWKKQGFIDRIHPFQGALLNTGRKLCLELPLCKTKSCPPTTSHQWLSMMKQSSALPITSPKNIPISRKQHLRNYHPSLASWHFCLSRRPRRQPRRLKSKISNLSAILVHFEQLPWVCFFFNFPQTTPQKISCRNAATLSSRNYVPESSYSFETGLLLCHKISKALTLGKMWTRENVVQPLSCLFPSSFVYPHLSICLSSYPTAM